MARRLRRRGHLDQRPGTVDVLLDELVSPLRYDVVVRQQFFAFLDANAELLDEFSDLVIEARGQPYFLWYRDIVIGERTKLLKGRTLDAFADQIERVLAMRARFNPADESWGILLREVPAGTQTATGKVDPLRPRRRVPPHRPAAPPRAQGPARRFVPARRGQAVGARQHGAAHPQPAPHRGAVSRLPRHGLRRRRPTASRSWSPGWRCAIPTGPRSSRA